MATPIPYHYTLLEIIVDGRLSVHSAKRIVNGRASSTYTVLCIMYTSMKPLHIVHTAQQLNNNHEKPYVVMTHPTLSA
jgi:hypothetical protein